VATGVLDSPEINLGDKRQNALSTVPSGERRRLRFCESCGAKLARLYPSCGHELKPEAKFCGECGAEVRGSGVGL
jgi:predicted amidophosphoribosyltransferase